MKERIIGIIYLIVYCLVYLCILIPIVGIIAFVLLILLNLIKVETRYIDILFLLLILSICIFGKEKKEYEAYLIRNGEKLLSYNDNADDTEEDEEYDMDEYDSAEEDPYYWETYIEDDTVENDMDLYEDPIEDDTEKNMSDFRK